MNLLCNLFKNSFIKKLKLNRTLKHNETYFNRKKFLFDKLKKDSYSFKIPSSVYKIKFVLSILFSKSNTIVTATNSKGFIIFSHSAGEIGFSGKQKKKRTVVLIKLFDLVLNKYKTYFSNFPVALHLVKTNSKSKFIVRHLKKHLNVKIIKAFSKISYNGCRRKKIKRKKMISNSFV